MGKNILVPLAICFIAYAPTGFAACLPGTSKAPECRYPQGDAWCEEHGQGNRFAYRDACLARLGSGGTSDASVINWIQFGDLDKHERRLVQLEESDSVHRMAFARVRLKERTPEDETDSLIVYNFNSCGTGGCALSIFSATSSGDTREVFSVSTGIGQEENGRIESGLSLGNHFRNGMRNLRFEDRVTWSWNGKQYDLQ